MTIPQPPPSREVEMDREPAGEMVERVARAIYLQACAEAWASYHAEQVAWERLPAAERGAWYARARAAIEAMREPTQAMIDAGQAAQDDDWIRGDALGWRQIPVTFTAMIDKALR